VIRRPSAARHEKVVPLTQTGARAPFFEVPFWPGAAAIFAAIDSPIALAFVSRAHEFITSHGA
jgi:hypothetical protein